MCIRDRFKIHGSFNAIGLGQNPRTTNRKTKESRLELHQETLQRSLINPPYFAVPTPQPHLISLKYITPLNKETNDMLFMIQSGFIFISHTDVYKRQELYNSVITQWMKQPSVTEITVEDPNESFDDLRDRCDFERLLKQGAFDNLPKDLPMSAGWLASKQSELKLEKRQFMRLFEMHLLYKHSPNFRLQVKKRIYEKNYEALVDMDAENKKDKLQTAFQSVSDDYKRIISKIVSLDKRASPVEHERKTKVAKQ